MKLKLEGASTMQKNLRTVTNRIAPNSYRTALLTSMTMIENAARRITPVKSTNLRDSVAGTQVITESNAFGAKGTMGFAANYAIYVHERVKTKKGALVKHKPGKTAKFLKKGIEAVQPKILGKMKVSFDASMFKRRII